MRKNSQRGASLIEILVVIVVFLVGILAIIQIFPPGLAALRTTNSNTAATGMAKAYLERLNASGDRIPEMIVSVNYLPGLIVVDPNQNWNELLPDRDAVGVGRLGIVTKDGSDHYPAGARVAEAFIDATTSMGSWGRSSGSNSMNRVIGEGGRAPTPRAIGSFFGGLIQLQFGPMYYHRDSGTGLSAPNLVQVYSQDLVKRAGSSDNREPDALLEADSYAVYTIPAQNARDASQTPFVSEDQLWVGATQGSGGPISNSLRIALTFTQQNGASTEEVQVIVPAIPAESAALPTAQQYMTLVNNRYWVISLPRLVSKPGTLYSAANFGSADMNSVRVQRLYDEIVPGAFWDDLNPYQYKVLDNGNLAHTPAGLGNILVNPAAFEYRIQRGSALEPLEANVDYTVFDWRIIRDEFRVPRQGTEPRVKLMLNSIRALDTMGADQLKYYGLELAVPSANGTVLNGGKQIAQDFVLIDNQTGGIIRGNSDAAGSSYRVNKNTGLLEFLDVDGAAGVQGAIYLPNPTLVTGWEPLPEIVSMEGRSVTALYMGAGEWAIQMHKAADFYNLIGYAPSNARPLLPGECYVGASHIVGIPVGQASRLYFPLTDLGHKIGVDELWVNGGNQLLSDRQFMINRTEMLNGRLVAFVDVGAPLSAAGRGFAVRGVKGLTMKARVLWNPEFFKMDADPTISYSNMGVWARSWRKVEQQVVFNRSVN